MEDEIDVMEQELFIFGIISFQINWEYKLNFVQVWEKVCIDRFCRSSWNLEFVDLVEDEMFEQDMVQVLELFQMEN